MRWIDAIRSALVRAGLASPPDGPHEFERAMQMLSHPPSAGPSVATVPLVMTPTTSSERCARAGCGRPANDPIHQIQGD
jgi:hypothetical protein